MSERTVPEQICAVLVLELSISKKEAERFLDFYRTRDYLFAFREGVLDEGYFLRCGVVGIEAAKRKNHTGLIKKVNELIWGIKEAELKAIRDALLPKVA